MCLIVVIVVVEIFGVDFVDVEVKMGDSCFL